MYSEACLILRERSAETIVGPAQGVLGTVGDAMPTGHCVCMRVGTTPLWGASADLTTMFAVAGERRDALWLRGRPAPTASTLPDSQLDDPMTPAEPDEASRRGSAEPAVDDLIASRRRARAERAERDASAAWSGLGRCAVAAGAALTPRAVDGSGARSGQRVRPRRASLRRRPRLVICCCAAQALPVDGDAVAVGRRGHGAQRWAARTQPTGDGATVSRHTAPNGSGVAALASGSTQSAMLPLAAINATPGTALPRIKGDLN